MQEVAMRVATASWEFPKIRGTLFWGSYNKDYSKVPYFRKLPVYKSSTPSFKDFHTLLPSQVEVPHSSILWTLNTQPLLALEARTMLNLYR